MLLTVTTKNRSPWLANTVAHDFLRQVWSNSTAWIVGDYLLMPDHLHAFCAMHDTAVEIEKWISFWKREFRILHGKSEWQFQSRGWHHRLRNGENYGKKWLYVQENPVRKNLVTRMEDWPFKGRVFDLPWAGK